jgi:hypothetical protein
MENVIDLHTPEKWNDLTAKQLEVLCRMIASGINPMYQRQLIFQSFTQIKPLPKFYTDQDGKTFYLFKHRPTKKQFYLCVDDYAWYLKKIDFTSEHSQLSKQLLPVVKSIITKLHGPATKLFNVKYGEFIHAESCFNRYLQTKDIKDLNALCAVLYRKASGVKETDANYDGDLRIAFNDYVYMHDAKRFKYVSVWKKIAIFMFYTGAREAMYLAHPHLQENATIGEDHTSDIEKHRALVNTLNNNDVTKNKAIYDSPVWDIFSMLDRMVEQYQKTVKK